MEQVVELALVQAQELRVAVPVHLVMVLDPALVQVQVLEHPVATQQVVDGIQELLVPELQVQVQVVELPVAALVQAQVQEQPILAVVEQVQEHPVVDQALVAVAAQVLVAEHQEVVPVAVAAAQAANYIK
jgi:hypothetical protein